MEGWSATGRQAGRPGRGREGGGKRNWRREGLNIRYIVSLSVHASLVPGLRPSSEAYLLPADAAVVGV